MATDLKDRLLKHYETGFPSREGVRVQDITSVGDGWETEVFSFALDYRETGALCREDLILRVYPGGNAAAKSAKEFAVMKRLHSLAYPVPQVFALQLGEGPLVKPFVIMEKITGPTMGAAFEAASEQERQELLRLFCRLFVDLHSLDPRPFATDLHMEVRPDSQSAVARALAQWREYVERFGRKEFAETFNWLVQHASDIGSERLALVHWDFHPWNILLGEGGSPFVIDWGGADVTDFRFDLAWTLLLVGTYGSAKARDLVLDEYKRIASYDVEQIDYFEAAACLKRLFSIAVSLSDGPEALGMRPGAERAMLENPEHIRAVQDVLRDRTGLVIPAIDDLLPPRL
jgi:aminoglycoside phosphotransferase (APT) family kinase protein